jgi:cell division protein ZapA
MTIIKTKLLGREWSFKCNPSEHAHLLESSLTLEAEMKKLNEEGRAVGYERILLLAALNLSYKLLEEQKKNRQNQNTVKEVKEKVIRLRDRLCSELETVTK